MQGEEAFHSRDARGIGAGEVSAIRRGGSRAQEELAAALRRRLERREEIAVHRPSIADRRDGERKGFEAFKERGLGVGRNGERESQTSQGRAKELCFHIWSQVESGESDGVKWPIRA